MSDSPFNPRRSLLRLPTANSTTNNFSINVPSEEYDQIYNSSNNSLRLLSRLQNQTAAQPTESLSNASFMDQYEDLDQGKSKTDVLFPQFVEIIQSHGHGTDNFVVLQKLTQACMDVIEQLEFQIERGVGGTHGAKQREAIIASLSQEINTWRLLHALYYDRVLVQAENAADDSMNDSPTLGGSEKEVTSQLYALNATLREYQLVVDWLEACYEQKDNLNLLNSHGRMMAWENTLYQLENLQGAAFGHGHEIVKELDPDAPVREKKPLHALDNEDNGRLARAIFEAIRNGRSDDALKLCQHYGQSWRAAILEGWHLHDDPNIERHDMGEKLPITGNPRRDLWKKCAWMLADSKKYDEYTRATAGIFCGHLGSLKSLLHNSWQDLLWAYIKVQIDIRVESEIRGCCLKRYHPMPEEYWNGKMTLEQIFDELGVAKDAAVRDYSQSQLGVIQRHLILDTSSELLQQMCHWLNSAKESLSAHQLRFMAHIVLFLRQIGRVDQEQYADRIIAAYVEALIQRADPELIAYYSAALPNKLQVQLYAKFLEQVEEKGARNAAIEAAINAGLDVEQITRYTTEIIRLSGGSIMIDSEPRAGEISDADKRKIHALEWLTYLPEQRVELLWQANALIRYYLAASKIECVRQIYAMVSPDVVSVLVSTFGSVDNMPPREECSLKEYLCYKIYLAAIDSFNEWTILLQSQPQPPQILQSAVKGNFTERVATEHKEAAFRSELTRWENMVQEQSKVTSMALYNVLLFPEKGWLNDPFIAMEPENAAIINWDHRLQQMEKLRSICLPEIVLLLHEVLHKSGDYAGCVRLADEISTERRQLYKVYTKHKLAELLAKIADSSVELLKTQLDPWGYPVTM